MCTTSKLRVLFIWWKFLELQTQEKASPGRTVSLEVEGGIRLCRSLQQGTVSLNNKRLLLIKESQISQIKEFSTVLYVGGCKCLGLLKSFLSYAFQLSGASILLLAFHNLRVAVKDSCWIAGIVLLFGHSQGPEIHIWRPEITGGCDILVYWHDRKHSISLANILRLTYDETQSLLEVRLVTILVPAGSIWFFGW